MGSPSISSSRRRSVMRGGVFSNLPIDVTEIKWRFACDQLVHARTQRIDIVEMSAAFASELLRAHIKQCPAFPTLHR